MAEERRAGVHPNEALAEVCEESHARHGIWSEIQKTKAVGVHDILEEIRKGGTEPAREIVDKEGIPMWGRPGAGGDDVRGWMPHLLSSRLHPPQILEHLLELRHVDRRGEVGELRPSHHQLALRLLCHPDVLSHPLAVMDGNMGGSRRRKKGGSGSKIGEDAGKG